MGIETHTCIVVLCDTCGDGWYQDHRPWHYTSADKAREHLTSPTLDDEGRWRIDDCVLCPDHRAQAECAARGGHTWGDWYPHPDSDLVSGRTCDHCGKFETNIAAVVEQMTVTVEEAPDA